MMKLPICFANKRQLLGCELFSCHKASLPPTLVQDFKGTGAPVRVISTRDFWCFLIFLFISRANFKEVIYLMVRFYYSSKRFFNLVLLYLILLKCIFLSTRSSSFEFNICTISQWSLTKNITISSQFYRSSGRNGKLVRFFWRLSNTHCLRLLQLVAFWEIDNSTRRWIVVKK